MSGAGGGPGSTGSSIRNVSSPQYLQPQRCSWRKIHQCEPLAEEGRVWSSRNGVCPTLTRGSRWEPPHLAWYGGTNAPCSGEEEKSFGWSEGSCPAHLPGCWDQCSPPGEGEEPSRDAQLERLQSRKRNFNASAGVDLGIRGGAAYAKPSCLKGNQGWFGSVGVPWSPHPP